jgi:hypothetical protein
VVKSVSYSCTKVGKTLKWSVASKMTTTTAVPRELAAIEVANKINSFIAPMRIRNQAVPIIEYRFGPSVSEADRTMTRQLAEAFFKYGSFPELANYRNAISVALTNEELVATTAGWQDTSNRPIFGVVIGALGSMRLPCKISLVIDVRWAVPRWQMQLNVLQMVTVETWADLGPGSMCCMKFQMAAKWR